jgi:hypothetical protein
MVFPPSTVYDIPVLKSDSEEARKAAILATSLVVATLPKGVFDILSFSISFKKSSVSTPSGANA